MYQSSTINKIHIDNPDIEFDNISIQKQQSPSLIYSRIGDKTSYKDRDSLVRIQALTGCLNCSYRIHFNVYCYDNLLRIKTCYTFPGFIPLLDLSIDSEQIVSQLIKGALFKSEFHYDKNNQPTISRFSREKLRGLFWKKND